MESRKDVRENEENDEEKNEENDEEKIKDKDEGSKDKVLDDKWVDDKQTVKYIKEEENFSPPYKKIQELKSLSRIMATLRSTKALMTFFLPISMPALLYTNLASWLDGSDMVADVLTKEAKPSLSNS